MTRSSARAIFDAEAALDRLVAELDSERQAREEAERRELTLESGRLTLMARAQAAEASACELQRGLDALKDRIIAMGHEL